MTRATQAVTQQRGTGCCVLKIPICCVTVPHTTHHQLLGYHFEYQASLIYLVSFPARQPPDRPRGLFETATPHLSPFSSGGRWCIPAGGSDLPGMHQECAPYPINRPYHGKASLGVISGLPRPFQAIGCHLRPHVCHICRKISEAWPI